MRNALAIWSCSARLIRQWLTLPRWRSCHERSIWRDQLEPAEEGIRRHAPVVVGAVSWEFRWCGHLAAPECDGRDAADSRAWNGRLPAAECCVVYRPTEPIGSSFSSTSL